MEIMTPLTRGGVYLARLDPAKHIEVGKIRPIVILTAQLILDSTPEILFRLRDRGQVEVS